MVCSYVLSILYILTGWSALHLWSVVVLFIHYRLTGWTALQLGSVVVLTIHYILTDWPEHTADLRVERAQSWRWQLFVLVCCRYSAVGKVASGHLAPIICLSIHNNIRGKQNLITGSKDHLIKIFDLSNEQSSNCLAQPKYTLDPPHYDGVQCLTHRASTLFSGSRDMGIKKWDLSEPTFQPQVCLSH